MTGVHTSAANMQVNGALRPSAKSSLCKAAMAKKYQSLCDVVAKRCHHAQQAAMPSRVPSATCQLWDPSSVPATSAAVASEASQRGPLPVPGTSAAVTSEASQRDPVTGSKASALQRASPASQLTASATDAIVASEASQHRPVMSSGARDLQQASFPSHLPGSAAFDALQRGPVMGSEARMQQGSSSSHLPASAASDASLRGLVMDSEARLQQASPPSELSASACLPLLAQATAKAATAPQEVHCVQVGQPQAVLSNTIADVTRGSVPRGGHPICCQGAASQPPSAALVDTIELLVDRVLEVKQSGTHQAADVQASLIVPGSLQSVSSQDKALVNVKGPYDPASHMPAAEAHSNKQRCFDLTNTPAFKKQKSSKVTGADTALTYRDLKWHLSIPAGYKKAYIDCWQQLLLSCWTFAGWQSKGTILEQFCASHGA